MDKERYRSEILRLRRAQWQHDLENKIRKDQTIRHYVSDLNEWHDAKNVLIYVSQDGEVDTRDLMKIAWAAHKNVIAPRVKGRSLDLCRITDFDDLVEGAYGIPEPKQSTECVDPSTVHLVIVPAIVFDRRGHRVGYGKGYYDRLLKKTRCVHLGLGYDFQVVPHIPDQDFDVPCDFVITDKEIIRD